MIYFNANYYQHSLIRQNDKLESRKSLLKKTKKFYSSNLILFNLYLYLFRLFQHQFNRYIYIFK